MMKSVACLVLMLVLAGCGSETGDSSEITTRRSRQVKINIGDTTKIKYEFRENGCTTGTQEFQSHEDYCEGLRSRSLNKGCAVAARERAWLDNCREEFSEASQTSLREALALDLDDEVPYLLDSRFLEMSVDGQVLSLRTQILTTPYAMRAADAVTVGGAFRWTSINRATYPTRATHTT